LKIAKLYSFNDIRIEDIPVPEVGPGDALMKTRASGICSGDVMPWYIEKKAPIVLGHEPSGEIVKLGSSLITHHSSLSVGDRVFVHHHAPCLTCRSCRRGDHVQCETWKNTSIIPGGISEYILIPEINLKNDTLKLSENMSFEDGTLIEPVACVLKGLKRAGFRLKDPSLISPSVASRTDLLRGEEKGGDGRGIGEGDASFSDRTVLVIGLGIMGQLNILVARRFGAGRIIGADMVQYRLQKAREFGADDVIDVSRDNLISSLRRLTDGEMADLVVVGPNSVEAMQEGISAAAAGGTVLLFTPAKPGEKLLIDPNPLYFNDINIVTSYSCGPAETREALILIEEGVVSAAKLVTHRFPIEKTAEAFRLTAEARESLKVVITF
jgi:L-iditol 2-dehydrogenase